MRFFLGIEIAAITAFASDALVLGESELGVDWVLGPSDRFALYAFNVEVGRLLADDERIQLRAIVEYLKPAHTHFVDLVEPVAVIEPTTGSLVSASSARRVTYIEQQTPRRESTNAMDLYSAHPAHAECASHIRVQKPKSSTFDSSNSLNIGDFSGLFYPNLGVLLTTSRVVHSDPFCESVETFGPRDRGEVEDPTWSVRSTSVLNIVVRCQDEAVQYCLWVEMESHRAVEFCVAPGWDLADVASQGEILLVLTALFERRKS